MTIAGVYLFMKYISPVFSPFICAFLLSGIIHRLAAGIPFKIRKSLLTVLLLLGLFLMLIAAIWGISTWLIQKGSGLAGQVQCLREEFCLLVGECCEKAQMRFGIDAKAARNFVLEQMNLFAENMEVRIFPAVMNKSVGYVKDMAGVIAFLAVTIIAAFLMLKDYEKLVRWMLASPEIDGIWEVAGKVIKYIKTYVKAQLTILLIISSVCAVSLGVLGIGGGVLLGILTGFMDMLPFIGTGIMLVPVAVFQLLSANYFKAAAVLVLYGSCVLLREVLEPRLIGNKVGIWPVGILFAVFAGVKLFGISGIIKGPIGLVIIFETCRYLTNNYAPQEGEREP